ncbi:glycerophosphoinositol permease [Lodderomyces elongisporus]|uniref:glycerophosphoinositol permease n=1 Tax=Lodderomyces elongisporus TaxID=36914 RepID=UPI0029222DBE|nr:glycerophosphoinositol permease [Lodderomyces elongisporus]WLF81138.1 glycerophosphoinositol permease [Lodderomyces elongisporus]
MASRDLPHSFNELVTGWARRIPSEITILNRGQLASEETDVIPDVGKDPHSPITEDDESSVVETKVRVKNLWPAFASGAGLFSDGYVNNSISTVLFCLKTIYGDEFSKSNAINNIGSIAFVGTVVGQLSFGYISDRIARKGGMMAANIMLIVFTLLCAVGSWGKTTQGFFACLTVWRFFLGVAIGAEYPTSSVIASEFANQLPAGHRNRYFSWFTNFMIDFGFVVSAFVPFVLIWIFTEKHLRALWRLTIGLGVIPPLSLFLIRLKMKDSKSFNKLHMKSVRYRDYPWWLIVKFYWFRLTIVSLIWFIYDFSAYSFGSFNTIIISEIIPDAPIWKQWGWSVVFNLFYLPGAFLGALSADYIGPRLTLAIGVGCQGIIGFAMSARLNDLKKHIAGFVVTFGIFSTFGEFGPGNNIGLLAAKTSATAIRGQYYGIAAAIGKIGAFVGTWVFPAIQKHYAYDEQLTLQVPFYISSALCMLSASLALFFLPFVGQDAINREDADFVNYLKANGFDTALLGEPGVVNEHGSDGVTAATDESGESLEGPKTEDYNVEHKSM